MRSSKGGPLQAREIAQEIGLLGYITLIIKYVFMYFNPIWVSYSFFKELF